MQGKNPPAEPGPAGGLRFGAWDDTETLEISGRSRDLLYLCVITHFGAAACSGGGRVCDGEAGGLARPPALAALPSRLLGNTPAADSRRRVVVMGGDGVS